MENLVSLIALPLATTDANRQKGETATFVAVQFINLARDANPKAPDCTGEAELRAVLTIARRAPSPQFNLSSAAGAGLNGADRDAGVDSSASDFSFTATGGASFHLPARFNLSRNPGRGKPNL